MSEHNREQVEMESVIADLGRASAIQVIGWTLLVFDALVIGIWLFTGYRSGTWFWLYWFVIEGALGLALVVASSYLKTRAGHHAKPRDRGKIRRVA
jgi:hypothetical protein